MTVGSNGVDESLLAELRRTARHEAAQRLQHARADATHRLATTRARLERERDQAVRHHREELAVDHDRRLDAARAEAGRVTLAAQERLIERVLASVRRRAPDRLRSAEAAGWLRRTLQEALTFLPDGGVTIRCGDPRGETLAREVAPDRLVRVERDHASSGMEVEAADGSVRVDATLERFLRAERSRLALAIVRHAAGVGAGTA